MNDALKTYPVAPPSIALALMILKSAHPGRWDTPPDRSCFCGACSRYFQTIDRISRGEQP